MDNIPKLGDAGVSSISIDRGVDRVAAGHLVDVHLGLPDTLADDLLGHNNITISTFGAVGNVTVGSLAKARGIYFESTYPLCREERCSQAHDSSR